MGVYSPFSGSDDFPSIEDDYHQPLMRYDDYSGEAERALGNPNPNVFTIKKYEEVGKFVIVQVRYPNCFNFEGEKILVFEGVSAKKIRGQSSLDPHFSDSNMQLSPIARFVPTKKGWKYALAFCKNA